jgi:hypothetical protein
MATDGWQSARAGLAELWRRARPGEVDRVESELAALRDDVLAARRQSDGDLEESLVHVWRLRLHELVTADPAIAGALGGLFDRPDADGAGRVVMNATVSGHAKVYQSGRDQHFSGQ